MSGPAGGAGPRVLLVGMMGAGKSTVGRALSELTGWPYVDNDELVRRATGEPTREVLDRHGTRALREAESAALTVGLAEPPPVVIGVAGGIVDDPADVERLRTGGHVVWLRASLDTLVERVGTGEGRPWLQPDPRAAIERLYQGRADRYAAAASQVVDVDGLAPRQIAATIAAAVGAG